MSSFTATRAADIKDWALHNSTCKPDNTERAFSEVSKWKLEKRKGEITLYFDGSGNVAKVKKSEYI